MKKILLAVIVAAAVAAFLTFTAPGQHVLNALGFATACPDNNC
jgi:hypothetical protein